MLKTLVGILNEELKTAQEFLEFSQKTTSALKNFKSSGFEASVGNSSNVISKLLDLEDQRTRSLLSISQELGVPCQNLTISELAKLPSSYSDDLIALKSMLFPLLKKIIKLSRVNKYLVSRSMMFMEDRIKIFHSTVTTNDTYGDRGKTIVGVGSNPSPAHIDTQI